MNPDNSKQENNENNTSEVGQVHQANSYPFTFTMPGKEPVVIGRIYYEIEGPRLVTTNIHEACN